MDDLPVGIELFELGYQKQHYIEAMNEVLDMLRAMVGDEQIDQALKAFESDGTHASLLFCAKGKVQEINVAPDWSFGVFIQRLSAALPDFVSEIEMASIHVCTERGIPITEDAIALARGNDVNISEFIR